MRRKLVVALLVLLVLGAGALYRFALPGLSSARPTPPAIEMEVATWLLRNSVPTEAAARVNPLKPDGATIAAGAEAFQQKCAVCHKFDGHNHRRTCLSARAGPSPVAPGADGRADLHLHQ
jgi:mono/diheme cytochrome c family protein